VPQQKTNPYLRQNKNPQHPASAQTHTKKSAHHKDERRNKILTLQKTETKLRNIPTTPKISQLLEKSMATLTTQHRKQTPKRMQDPIPELGQQN
jgi:hypothetical protein